MPKTILTITLNPTVDMNTAVGTVASEIKLRCEQPTFEPGGGGVNVSRAIHKLGGTSQTAYAQGGESGQMLARMLGAEGLSLHPITISGYTRQNVIVFERNSTLQYRFGMPGPELSAAEWQAFIDLAAHSDADFIVASGSLCPGVPHDFYARMAHAVPNAGQRLIVDTSGAALEAMRGTNVLLLKPNLDEIEALSGEKFSGEDELIAVAQHLIQRKMAHMLVISMGSAGALLVTEGEHVQMRPPVVPIKSKVGAGDSMVGGLTLALARGATPREALRYGIACGTAAVMTDGSELCRLEDVERILPKVREVT